MTTGHKLPKVVKHPKSSTAARRLIRSALRRCGSERAAARALGLSNNVVLHKMLIGTLKDTPAMQAALRRADRRAHLAWSFRREINPNGHVDRAVVAQLWKEFKSITRRFESLMKECETESRGETT